MKIQVTLKDPDSLNDEITDGVVREYPNEDPDIRAEKIADIRIMSCKWFKYGEYVTIEIDTETETAKVLEV